MILESDDLSMSLNHFLFDWKLILSVQETISLGSFLGGKLVGIINFRRVPGSLYDEVLYLEVLASYQNQGVGKKLLAMVMLDAFEQQYDGFVKLKTKTDGTQNYYLALGGILYGFNNIRFETHTSKNLVKNILNLEV